MGLDENATLFQYIEGHWILNDECRRDHEWIDYNRWIEKAETEIRSGALLNSSQFQKNFLEIIAISEQLIRNCSNFRGPDIEMVLDIAQKIRDLADNELVKIESGILDQEKTLEKLGKIKEKASELKRVYRKIITREFERAA